MSRAFVFIFPMNPKRYHFATQFDLLTNELNRRVSISVTEYEEAPNPKIGAVVTTVWINTRRFDLGDCAFADHMAVTNSVRRCLDGHPEGISEETLREIRNIVLIGQDELHLQIESPKQATPKKVVKHPKETAVQTALFSDFTPQEKDEIQLLALELRRLSKIELLKQIREGQSNQRLQRSAAIRAYALNRANGLCESCEVKAPFETKEGPYLEGHHVTPLSKGGSDTIANVIALCPNCHRKAHFSLEAVAFTRDLELTMTRKART
jgi:hypothetical protein